MEIHFKNTKIRKLCEKRKLAIKELGADCAKKLRIRLTQLEAATCVSDLKEGNPHPLKGDQKGKMSINLAGGCRLVFAPDEYPEPTRPEGGTNWSKVSIIKIEYIGDYHD